MHQGFRAYDGSGGGIESPEKKTFFYFAVDWRLASQQVTGPALDNAKPSRTGL